jgi:hypothetical protein
VPASVAGSRNTPDPIMLPTTSAVAIHSPIERLSFGAPTDDVAETDCGGTVIEDLLSGNVVFDRPADGVPGHRGHLRFPVRKATVSPAPPLLDADYGQHGGRGGERK